VIKVLHEILFMYLQKNTKLMCNAEKRNRNNHNSKED